jgi:hypothetical protein
MKKDIGLDGSNVFGILKVFILVYTRNSYYMVGKEGAPCLTSL